MKLLTARVKVGLALAVVHTPLFAVHHLNQWAARAIWCGAVEEALNR
jgi:hypothetical protein